MSDLTAFARDTERRVRQPAYEELVARHRRRQVRRVALLCAAAVLAVAAVALLPVRVGRPSAERLPALPAPEFTSVAVPGWSAEQMVGHPDAFVVTQLESRADRRTVLTVWKRCATPAPDQDCLGREAIAVVDGTGHRLVALGAVTAASSRPSPQAPDLFREVGDGLWYWAHVGPGPYLLSPTLRQPVPLTVQDRAEAVPYGTPTVECADGVGLCALDPDARTLQRIALPAVDGVRWATPTAKGCGIWGLAAAGGDPRLVVQQRDGSFAAVALARTTTGITMAEGGPGCEVAVYQGVSDMVSELLVSLDDGATWQVRGPIPPPQHLAGLVEEKPRLRVLLPARWAALPATRSSHALPGPRTPL